MEQIKKIRQQMKEKGVNEAGNKKFLQLGEKLEDGGVKSNGKHIVKLLAEPIIEKGQHFHTRIERQELRFRLEENGEEKLWNIAIFKLDGKGNPEKGENGQPIENYLIPQLEPINVGDSFSLELKSKNGRNFVNLEYPLNNDIPTTEMNVAELDVDKPTNVGGEIYDW